MRDGVCAGVGTLDDNRASDVQQAARKRFTQHLQVTAPRWSPFAASAARALREINIAIRDSERVHFAFIAER
jgi:hypothetical protein